MCPGCVTAVLLMVGGATSIASVTAFGPKRLRGNAGAMELERITQSKGDQDGRIDREQTGASKNSVPS